MELTTISLEVSSRQIGIGGMSVIWATCIDQDNKTMKCPTITWSISNPALADLEPYPDVVASLVTGKSSGSVDITASVGNVSSSITIDITGPLLHYIEITPKIINVEIGKTLVFNADCRDQFNGFLNCPTLTWNSSNPLVGTIDQTGEFTGLSEGTVEIMASANGLISNIALVAVSQFQVKLGDFMIFGGLVIGTIHMIFKKPSNRTTKTF